jgi:uncharacterized protein with ParB-like and HNH nuclease domain
MSALEVSSVQVPGIMERLKRNEWLVPEFQRDFVWSVSDIKNLALSIIDSRPIGMATLWEQEEDAIPLEPLSINDYDIMRKERTRKYIGDVF